MKYDDELKSEDISIKFNVNATIDKNTTPYNEIFMLTIDVTKQLED